MIGPSESSPDQGVPPSNEKAAIPSSLPKSLEVQNYLPKSQTTNKQLSGENLKLSGQDLHKEILTNHSLLKKIESELLQNGACYLHKNDLLKTYGILRDLSILIVKGFGGKPIFCELTKESFDYETSQVKRLGKGNWGSVREIKNLETGEVVALKKYVFSQITDNYSDYEGPKNYFTNVSKVLNKIYECKDSLPGVATFFGYGFAKDKKGEDCFYILLEKLDKPLKDELQTSDLSTKKRIASEIIGIFLEAHKVNLHLVDYNVENLMYDAKEKLKFFDIELAHVDLKKSELGSDSVQDIFTLIWNFLDRNKVFFEKFQKEKNFLEDGEDYNWPATRMLKWIEEIDMPKSTPPRD